VLRALIEQKPMVWFETRASILGLDQQIVTAPDLHANYLQLKEAEAIEWMEANGYPSRIIKLKGRRQGSSTGTIANMAHCMRRKPTGGFICGLDFDKNVRVMEAMFWRFVDTDQHDWGVTGSQRKGSGGEFDNGSILSLYSANAGTGGRGAGAQFGLFTEAAHYPKTPGRDENELIASLFQLVPRTPGTVIVLESTPKGEGGKFHSTWTGALTFEELKAHHAAGTVPSGWNGFVKIFQAWHEFPGYTVAVTPAQANEIMRTLTRREEELLEEYEHIDAGRLAWRRKVLAGPDFDGDEELFEQEYPSDDVRCFAGSGRKVFLWKSVSAMKERARDGETGTVTWTGGKEGAAFEIGAEEHGHWLRMWEKPTHGHSYLIVVDPMTGDQAGGDDPDSHGALVLRAGGYTGAGWRPPGQAARLADVYGERQSRRKNAIVCRWGIDILEERIARTAKLYGDCLVVVEENMDRGLIQLLRQRNNVHLYRRETEDKVTKVVTEFYGWRTTAKNRTAILEGLVAAVRNLDVEGSGIECFDARVLTEMERFIEDEDGRWEAGSGWHDDGILAWAIGKALLGKATPYVDRVLLRQMRDDDDDDGRRRRNATWG
jgi:hypothetical protein